MVRLADLNPKWIDHEGRKGLGVAFDCMVGHCKGRIWVLFANPLDGGEPWPGNSRSLIVALTQPPERYDIRGCGDCRWQRTGDDFTSMSLSPSVDAYDCGHLTLANGAFA